MTKLVAHVALIVAGLAVMLGNYWFTFGLWPLSWWAFVGFGCATIGLMIISELMKREGK